MPHLLLQTTLPTSDPWWSSAVLLGVIATVVGYYLREQAARHKDKDERIAEAKQRETDANKRAEEANARTDRALDAVDGLTQNIMSLTNALTQVTAEVQKSNANVEAFLRTLMDKGGRA